MEAGPSLFSVPNSGTLYPQILGSNKPFLRLNAISRLFLFKQTYFLVDIYSKPELKNILKLFFNILIY